MTRSQPPRSTRNSIPPAFAAPLFAIPMACSGASEHPPAPTYSDTSTDGLDTSNVEDVRSGEETCEEGEVVKCKVVLGEYDGIVSCFIGVQACVDGNWGPCAESETASFDAALAERAADGSGS